MPRKLRIQFEGAIYHVINRGNYRRDIFGDTGANQAFERELFAAAKRFGWTLHAFVLMRNHFHLVVEITKTNLSEGMQWLQVHFALRFNRYRSEQGHLFQGRYRAILVEAGPSLVRLVNYVHLNPVAAKIIEAEKISEFRWSSLHHFILREAPPILSSEAWLEELSHSGISDIPAYVAYLQKLAMDRAEQKRQGWDGFNFGWAIGTQAWRKAMAERYADLSLTALSDARANSGFIQMQWAEQLAELLRLAGKGPKEIAEDRKGSDWKIEIAAALRSRTTASCSWIAKELNMGAASSLRQYLSQARRKSGPALLSAQGNSYLAT